MRNIVTALCALASLTVTASTADAGTCESVADGLLIEGRPKSIPDYLTKVDKCFGSPADDDALVRQAYVALDSAEPAAKRAIRATEILQVGVLAMGDALHPDSARLVAVERLRSAQQAMKDGGGAGAGVLAGTDWDWEVAKDLPAVPELKIADALIAACAADGSIEQCTAARARTHAWLRTAALIQFTLSVYAEDYIAKLEAQIERRVKMWNAYRDEALPQFPWEYLVNSIRMGKADDRPRDADDKNPQGFEPIPNSQIIFMHPGASLEWRDGGDSDSSSDSDAKQALYLEIVGINRWNWNEDTGAMIGGKGMSLIMSYTNRDGAEDVGYGIMFHSRHTKQFTLGITRAGGEMVYLLNVDLAEYVKEKLSYWDKVGEKIKDLREKLP